MGKKFAIDEKLDLYYVEKLENRPHAAAIPNRTIFLDDNLVVMRGNKENRGMDDESIDLIVTDPPFKSDRKIQTKGQAHKYPDSWGYNRFTDEYLGQIQKEHKGIYTYIVRSVEAYGKGNMAAYLTFMAPRLIEMQRILKPTGSIYLHCDHHASHYLKILMDMVFGSHSFRNEIVWCYLTGGASPKQFAKKHDIILVYGKTKDAVFNAPRIPYNSIIPKKYAHKWHAEGKIMPDWFADYGNVSWRIPALSSRDTERVKDAQTQKPQALYERLIEAGSKPGARIFDPFCGAAATSLVAAESTGREWIGVDIVGSAVEGSKAQIVKAVNKHWINAKENHQSTGTLDVEEAEKVKPKTIYWYEGTGGPKQSLASRDPEMKRPKGSKHDIPRHTIYRDKKWYKQEGRCAGCARLLPPDDMECDHICPVVLSMDETEENMQVMCPACNRRKSHRWTHIGFRELMREEGAMNTKHDLWLEVDRAKDILKTDTILVKHRKHLKNTREWKID